MRWNPFRRKDRSLAPGPLDSFWYSLFPMMRSGNKVNVNEHTAYNYSVVWAATRLLSATGSSLPMHLYRRVGDDRRVIAREHPVHKLFRDGFNAEIGAMVGRSMGIQRQVNQGNFFAYINRSDPRRLKLEPIHHSKLKPVRVDAEMAAKLGVEEESLAWEYREKGQDVKTIPDIDMFHVTSMMSDDGIIGKGVVTQARESIALGIATENQGLGYMENAARPSIVIKGNFKDKEQRQDFRREWDEVHGGASSNAKPALLPPSFEIDKLTFSPEDSQFLQTRQHNVEEVARWYGVPPHMIGHLLRSTFNNIETQSIEFVVYSLVPWLKLWEEEISRKLLTDAERDEYYPKHNIEGLLRGDTAARAAFYNALWNLGVISVNEIRVKEDLNPIGPEGDKRFVPLNYTTLDKAGEPDEMQTGPDGTVLRWGNNRIEDMLGQQLDNQREALTRLIEFTETNKPGDSIQRAVDLALSHKHIDESSLRQREKVLRQTAAQLVRESWAKCVNKELTALSRAAGKTPGEFFKSLDGVYEKLAETAVKVMDGPLSTWLLAVNSHVNAADMVAAFCGQSLEQHREQVLELTSCDESEWGAVRDKLVAMQGMMIEEDMKRLGRIAEQEEVLA